MIRMFITTTRTKTNKGILNWGPNIVFGHLKREVVLEKFEDINCS